MITNLKKSEQDQNSSSIIPVFLFEYLQPQTTSTLLKPMRSSSYPEKPLPVLFSQQTTLQVGIFAKY